MTLRTANLLMTPNYPGGRQQEISGYSEMRIQEPFVIFIIDGENKEHLYFKTENIIEIVTVKGKI